jgi:hypothetical protein
VQRRWRKKSDSDRELHSLIGRLIVSRAFCVALFVRDPKIAIAIRASGQAGRFGANAHTKLSTPVAGLHRFEIDE